MGDDKNDDKDNAFEQAAKELLVDPDAPENGKTSPPPQTIDAEPAEKD